MSADQQDKAQLQADNANISRLNTKQWTILQLKIDGFRNSEIARGLSMHHCSVALVVNNPIFRQEFAAEVERRGVDVPVDDVTERCESIVLEALSFGSLRMQARDENGEPIPDKYRVEIIPADQILREARHILTRRQKPVRSVPKQVGPAAAQTTTSEPTPAAFGMANTQELPRTLGDTVILQYKERNRKEMEAKAAAAIPPSEAPQPTAEPTLIKQIPPDSEISPKV